MIPPIRGARRWLDIAEQVTTSLALVGILGLIFLGVILRYVFASGITWGEEIARVMFIGMTYMAISRVDSHDMHFRVTLLEDLLPGLDRYMMLISALVQFALLTLLSYLAGSIGLFIRQMGQHLPASGLPAYLFYVPIVVGLALGTLRALERVIRCIGDLRNRAGGPSEHTP